MCAVALCSTLYNRKPATGEVTTVAGTGSQWRGSVDFDAHPAGSVDLSSPWDLAWYDGKVIIAMAGIHQLWWFDPRTATAGVYAGTTLPTTGTVTAVVRATTRRNAISMR